MQFCMVCKAKFHSQRSNAKYCSNRCTQVAKREREKAIASGVPLELVPFTGGPAQAHRDTPSPSPSMPQSSVDVSLPLLDQLAQRLDICGAVRRAAEGARAWSAMPALLRLEVELTREIAQLKAKDTTTGHEHGSAEEILEELLDAIAEMPDKYLDRIVATIAKRRPTLRIVK